MMKTPIAFLSCVFFSIVGLFGQPAKPTSYDVVELPFLLNGVRHNAYMVSTDVDQQIALESWAKMMADNGSDTYLLDPTKWLSITKDVQIPEISSSRLNVYFQPRYDGSKDGSLLTFWFQLPDGSYLSSRDRPKLFHKLSKFLVDFGLTAKHQLEQAIHRENVGKAEGAFPSTSKRGKSIP